MGSGGEENHWLGGGQGVARGAPTAEVPFPGQTKCLQKATFPTSATHQEGERAWPLADKEPADPITVRGKGEGRQLPQTLGSLSSNWRV